MCEILDGGRKFGLHLVLAHQHLNQLKVKDPEVYYSVLTNARLKTIFGGLIDEDLDVVAKEVADFDPNEVKDEIWQTKYRPVETTRVIVSESETHVDNYSAGEITHASLVSGELFIPGSGWLSSPQLAGLSEVASSGSGSSSTEGSADSYSTSRAEVPWYEYHPYQELSSRTFRTLEEQLYIKKAQMKRQMSQHAAILIPGTSVQFAKTPTLKDLAIGDSVRREFLHACIEHAGCFKSPVEAQCEIGALQEKLLADAPKSAPPYQRGTPMIEFLEPPPSTFRDED